MGRQDEAVAKPRSGARLGQHFLTDRNILHAVADAARVEAGDSVVEVGPGHGSLTRVLAERAARVVAVELDDELGAELRRTMPPNVEVVLADARETSPRELLGGCGPYRFAGNLPYYAALPILRRFIESDCPPQTAAVLVQKEVADALCAKPGDMSLASLGVQLFGAPRLVRRVRPGSFTPPPQVTSAIVAIDLYGEPAEGIDNTARFFDLARAAFAAPRKQLRNALSSGAGVTVVEAQAALEWAGIDHTRRAETLSLQEWASLYRAWRRRVG